MRVAEKSKAKAKFSQARKSKGKVMPRLEMQWKEKRGYAVEMLGMAALWL